MNSTHYFLLTGALLLAGKPAQAQQGRIGEEAITGAGLAASIGTEELGRLLAAPATAGSPNVVVLMQNGSNNIATAEQKNLSGSGLSNQAYIAQVGAANALGIIQSGAGNRMYTAQQGVDNSANFTQNGQGNSTTVTQRGSGNRIQGTSGGSESSFLLEGNYNSVSISQDGNNNTVKGDVRESNRIYTIRQQGVNNTLTQIESTLRTPKGYTVEMRGQGINLTIEQSKAFTVPTMPTQR